MLFMPQKYNIFFNCAIFFQLKVTKRVNIKYLHLCYSYNPRQHIPPLEVASNSWVCA